MFQTSVVLNCYLCFRLAQGKIIIVSASFCLKALENLIDIGEFRNVGSVNHANYSQDTSFSYLKKG